MKSKVPALLFVAMIASPVVADALVITYLDEASFLAATGSESAPLPTTLPTTGPPRTVPLSPSPISLTYENTALIVGTGTPQTGWNYTGRRSIVFGWERFELSSTSPLNAIGFSVYEPTSSEFVGCNTACLQTTFSIELFSGSTSLGQFSLSPADRQWVFWGASSDIAFDRVRVYDPFDDNEFFSQFLYSAVDDTVSVPEPGTLTLLGIGLGALGLSRKRKNAK